MTDNVCFRGLCKFEPRYNSLSPSDVAIEAIMAVDFNYESDRQELLDKTATSIYLGDICMTCGRVIPAPTSESN